MEILIGAVLALSVSVFATVVGLDRERPFYATVTIVVASYYVLFAVMGGSSEALIAECVVIVGFVLVAATLRRPTRSSPRWTACSSRPRATSSTRPLRRSRRISCAIS